MIKVLAVMDGTGTGGAETSMAAMAPLMAENGVELEVAYFHDRSGAKEKFVEAGIPLHHVPPGRTRLATVWRLRKLIKERQPRPGSHDGVRGRHHRANSCVHRTGARHVVDHQRDVRAGAAGRSALSVEASRRSSCWTS